MNLSAVPELHHDVVLLPNGGAMALSRETQRVNGQLLTGDVIVELTASGEIVWEWSTFDHLDTTRFPSELSLSTGRGGGGELDWTHGNAVAYFPESNSVLLSLRSQSWVVHIDRATGEIIWIAGDSTGTAPGFTAPFLQLASGTWQTAQHAATFAANGELVIYDNRNDSGGETNNSRAVAYSIDGNTGVATESWSFIAPKFTESFGDVDPLDNGNVLVNAGGRGSSADAHIIEVGPSGETVWALTVAGTALYRAERVSWTEIASSCLLYTSPSPRDQRGARMPSSA